MSKQEKLTLKELRAQKSFLAKLNMAKRKTAQSVIVAMVGLVGSGKNSVAKYLADKIGAAVIMSDDIRVELRKQSERYERAGVIAENAAFDVLEKGGNAIVDADFIKAEKRKSLNERARKAGVKLFFIRTYCDPDVMIGRIAIAPHHNLIDDFFGGASSKWQGAGKQSKGAAVKLREMWRRTPHHYKWVDQGGGKWVLKKLPFAVFAEIDTTTDQWKKEIDERAKKILG